KTAGASSLISCRGDVKKIPNWNNFFSLGLRKDEAFLMTLKNQPLGEDAKQTLLAEKTRR
ncbi:MAG: hypothetical protein ACOYN8_13660, partial [Pseudanabaena sp.]